MKGDTPMTTLISHFNDLSSYCVECYVNEIDTSLTSINALEPFSISDVMNLTDSTIETTVSDALADALVYDEEIHSVLSSAGTLLDSYNAKGIHNYIYSRLIRVSVERIEEALNDELVELQGCDDEDEVKSIISSSIYNLYTLSD
jgi:hypothetical protein